MTSLCKSVFMTYFIHSAILKKFGEIIYHSLSILRVIKRHKTLAFY